MAGILDLLSPALTVATQATATANQAEAQKALQDAALKRQAAQDAIRQQIQSRQLQSMDVVDALHRAETEKNQFAITHQKPEHDPYGPQALDFRKSVIDYERERGYHAPQGGASADPRIAKQKFFERRIPELTKPTKARYGNTLVPGMALDAATKRANEEWAAVNGEEAPTVAPPPPRPTAVPQQHDDGSAAEYAQVAELYKKALARKVDPTQARKAYDDAVADIAKRHGAKNTAGHPIGDITL